MEIQRRYGREPHLVTVWLDKAATTQDRMLEGALAGRKPNVRMLSGRVQGTRQIEVGAEKDVIVLVLDENLDSSNELIAKQNVFLSYPVR